MEDESSCKNYKVRNFLKQIDDGLNEMRKRHMSSTKSLVDFEYTQTNESQKQTRSNVDVNQCSNIKIVGKKQNTEVKHKNDMPPSQEVTILKAIDTVTKGSVSFELSTQKQTK
jgi:hypothetical protein